MSNYEEKKYIVTYKDGTDSELLSFWEAEEEWISGYAIRCIVAEQFTDYKAP